ncbi:MAG: Gfo/Idh/MocA family oxidoreductase [Candidatus Omnitrophica bacterium]|nr:Gfo/Idh/MocA family oxidoreductase [Candidatus Omnitrophota bacterium]
MDKSWKTTRRDFLSKTAALAGGAAAFQIVPRRVLGAPNRPAPSDTVVLGNIGVGGRGSAFLRPGVSAAICDVDDDHLKRAAERVGGNPFLCKDYRELLDQSDIDAVTIGTPDHWHGLMCVHACEAGKDVYVEKPACKTIEEGRAMVNASKRYARIVQVGSQGRSTEAAYRACRYIRNGQIGRVSKVNCWHYENPVGDWTPDSDPPPTLDWGKWLGPARWMPYNPQKVHFNFRWLLDFGGGQIRDRGAHVMSVAFWCMDSDHTGPVSVEATGEPPGKGVWDCPPIMDIKYVFKNPDWEMTWTQPGEKLLNAPFGAKYWGDKDTLIVTGGDGGCGTEDKAMNYEPPSNGAPVFHSPGHFQNWMDCIKTREKPIMHIEAGHRVAVLCILGNISYILGRKLEWDPVLERVKNDDEANRLLSRPGRGEWHL